MVELNPDEAAKIAAWIEEGKRLVGLTPADDAVPAPDEGEAPPAPEAEQFSTPALASSAPPPASVPTIEPVPEDQVPDDVKAADQAKG